VIVPWGTVPNRASCALGVAARAARQVADDWEPVYHVRPVACETFVETRRFTGAGYRAANWLRIGETQPIFNKIFRKTTKFGHFFDRI